MWLALLLDLLARLLAFALVMTAGAYGYASMARAMGWEASINTPLTILLGVGVGVGLGFIARTIRPRSKGAGHSGRGPRRSALPDEAQPAPGSGLAQVPDAVLQYRSTVMMFTVITAALLFTMLASLAFPDYLHRENMRVSHPVDVSEIPALRGQFDAFEVRPFSVSAETGYHFRWTSSGGQTTYHTFINELLDASSGASTDVWFLNTIQHGDVSRKPERFELHKKVVAALTETTTLAIPADSIETLGLEEALASINRRPSERTTVVFNGADLEAQQALVRVKLLGFVIGGIGLYLLLSLWFLLRRGPALVRAARDDQTASSGKTA